MTLMLPMPTASAHYATFKHPVIALSAIVVFFVVVLWAMKKGKQKGILK